MEGTNRSTVSLRSILLGAGLIPLICLWDIQVTFVWYRGQITTISIFWHCLVFIFLFSLFNTIVLKRYAPRMAFDPGEILTVYIMLNLGAVMSSHDLLQILVPMLMTAYWNASPENGWDETVLPLLPEHLIVTDVGALRGAFEGESSMYTLRVLSAFAKPLFWWGTFTFAFVAIMLLMNVLLRKQWVVKEKLAYPLIHIPLEVAREPTRLVRNRLFLYGFGLAAGIDLLNGFHALYPLVPELRLIRIVNLNEYLPNPPWNAVGGLPVSIYPFAVGLCFFLPADLAFSCWFFFLFWKAQAVLASALGISNIPGLPFTMEQSAGGYLGLSLIALWLSRNHLKQIALRALGRETELSDEDEPLSYRAALLLILLFGAYLVGFCRMAGMSWIVIGVFWVLFFMIAIAIARLRAELGPPGHDLHYTGPEAIISKAVGIHALGPQTAMMFSFFWYFNRAYRAHPMAVSLEGFKMAEREKMDGRRVLLSMIVAVAVGIVVAFWALIHVSYQHGISGSMSIVPTIFGNEPWGRLHAWTVDPPRENIPATIALFVGIGTALFLAVMRSVFTWWALHPVGYAVSASWSLEQLWVSMFLGWLAKWSILRYGGAKAYQPAVPFFTGLVFGEFLVGGGWNTYGVLRGVSVYQFWP